MYKKLKNDNILDSVAGGLYTPAEKNEDGVFDIKNEILKERILENCKEQKKINE